MWADKHAARKGRMWYWMSWALFPSFLWPTQMRVTETVAGQQAPKGGKMNKAHWQQRRDNSTRVGSFIVMRANKRWSYCREPASTHSRMWLLSTAVAAAVLSYVHLLRWPVLIFEQEGASTNFIVLLKRQAVVQHLLYSNLSGTLLFDLKE